MCTCDAGALSRQLALGARAAAGAGRRQQADARDATSPLRELPQGGDAVGDADEQPPPEQQQEAEEEGHEAQAPSAAVAQQQQQEEEEAERKLSKAERKLRKRQKREQEQQQQAAAEAAAEVAQVAEAEADEPAAAAVSDQGPVEAAEEAEEAVTPASPPQPQPAAAAAEEEGGLKESKEERKQRKKQRQQEQRKREAAAAAAAAEAPTNPAADDAERDAAAPAQRRQASAGGRASSRGRQVSEGEAGEVAGQLAEAWRARAQPGVPEGRPGGVALSSVPRLRCGPGGQGAVKVGRVAVRGRFPPGGGRPCVGSGGAARAPAPVRQSEWVRLSPAGVREEVGLARRTADYLSCSQHQQITIWCGLQIKMTVLEKCGVYDMETQLVRVLVRARGRWRTQGLRSSGGGDLMPHLVGWWWLPQVTCYCATCCAYAVRRALRPSEEERRQEEEEEEEEEQGGGAGAERSGKERRKGDGGAGQVRLRTEKSDKSACRASLAVRRGGRERSAPASISALQGGGGGSTALLARAEARLPRGSCKQWAVHAGVPGASWWTQNIKIVGLVDQVGRVGGSSSPCVLTARRARLVGSLRSSPVAASSPCRHVGFSRLRSMRLQDGAPCSLLSWYGHMGVRTPRGHGDGFQPGMGYALDAQTLDTSVKLGPSPSTSPAGLAPAPPPPHSPDRSDLAGALGL